MDDWINYHHLRYFWAVVTEGGVGKAAERLNVAQPTISRQLKELEEALGTPLLERVGRGLEPTAVGREVFERAQQIIDLGQDILQLAQGQSSKLTPKFRIGVVDVLPKYLAFRVLQPLTQQAQIIKLVLREGSLQELSGQLIRHQLDVVLSDSPAPIDLSERLRDREVIDSKIGLFAQTSLARILKKGFPESLNDMPVLLPTEGSILRRSFETWIHKYKIKPVVAGEFDDFAMLKAFARNGAGIFPAPMAIEEELLHVYGFSCISAIGNNRERLHALYMQTDPLPGPLQILLTAP